MTTFVKTKKNADFFSQHPLCSFFFEYNFGLQFERDLKFESQLFGSAANYATSNMSLGFATCRM